MFMREISSHNIEEKKLVAFSQKKRMKKNVYILFLR